MPPSPHTIKKWLQKEYPDKRIYDNSNSTNNTTQTPYIKIADPSGANYLKIYPDGASFIIQGDLGIDTIATSCDANKEILLNTLEEIYNNH